MKPQIQNNTTYQSIALTTSLCSVVIYSLFPSQALFFLLFTLVICLPSYFRIFTPFFLPQFTPPLFFLFFTLFPITDPIEGDWFSLLALANFSLQFRGLFYAKAYKLGERNKLFAQDLREKIPPTSTIFIDNDIQDISPTEAISEGHVLRISPNEFIPADGIVTYGSSFVLESHLNGSKEPVAKSSGDSVFAGTENKSGTLLMKVQRKGNDTFLSQLAANLEKQDYSYFFFAETLTCFCLLICAILLHKNAAIILSSAASAIFLFLYMSKQELTAKLGAVGAYIKDTSCSDLGKIRTIISDHFCILTDAKIKIMSTTSESGLTEDAILRLLAPVARKIDDEFANAVILEARLRNIPFELLENYMETPTGGGGIVSGEYVEWVSFPKEDAFDTLPSSLAKFARQKTSEGCLLILFKVNEAMNGAVAFSCSIKNDSLAALTRIKNAGMNYILSSEAPRQFCENINANISLPHIHVDPTGKERPRLLQKLKNDGLAPLWHSMNQNLPGVLHSKFSSFAQNADITLLYGDLNTLTEAILLLKKLARQKKLLITAIVLLQLLVFLPFDYPHAYAAIGLLALLFTP